MTSGAARVLALLLCTLILVGCVHGASLTVAPEGSAYTDLQQALDTAAPGDEIVVRPGTYPGEVIVRIPVSISGENGATVGSEGDSTAISVNADNVTITGLVCTGAGAGIIANQTTGLVIRDCQVISDGVAILCTGCRESALTNIQVMARQTGISAGLCTGVAITGCRINAEGTGVALRDTVDATLEGTHLLGAELGILTENTEHCGINDTTFAGNGAGILGVGITDCTVSGSEFSDVIQYIQLYAASGCRVDAPSLAGPVYFAADIFSDTTYRCGPYSVTGNEFGLLADAYTPPEDYRIFGDAMNITFITAAESAEPQSVTVTADIPTELPGLDENTYGIYRTDGEEPVLIAVPDSGADGNETVLQATVTDPAHLAVMARTAAEDTPYTAIFLWAALALGVLLLLVLWRKR